MELSTLQYQTMLSRLTKIERTLNDALTAQRRFVSDAQVNEVFTVLQQEISNLTATVAALTTRLATVEQEPYDENG